MAGRSGAEPREEKNMYTVYTENAEVKMPFDATVEYLISEMISSDGDHYPLKIADFRTREDCMNFLAKQENRVRRIKTQSGGYVWEVEAFYMENEDGDIDFLC